MTYQEKLKDRFPKEKKEREYDTRVLSKEESWEFECRLREKLKSLREEILSEMGVK